MKGAPDTLGILGHQKLGVVASDDLVGGVPEQVSHLGIGEGEVSLGVEDADEVGATLDEGAIPRLGQGQFLHRTVVALLPVFWRVVRVLVAHDSARITGWESCFNVALD